MPKRRLRERLHTQRGALEVAEARERSAQVAARIGDLAEWRASRTIAFYAAAHGEVDVSPLAEWCLAHGRQVVFPRVAETGLSFCRVKRLAELTPGRFGIRAPPREAQTVSDEAIDLFLVPGLAFDAQGRRLGRGRGYFDAALRRARGVKVGVAWNLQIVDRVPVDDHDVQMDIVVTESRVYRRRTP